SSGAVRRGACFNGSANALSITAFRVPELPCAWSRAAVAATANAWPTQAHSSSSSKARVAAATVGYRLHPVSPSGTGKILMALSRSELLPSADSASFNQLKISLADPWSVGAPVLGWVLGCCCVTSVILVLFESTRKGLTSHCHHSIA